MKDHQTQWDQLQLALQHKRIPQALLFVGPMHCGIADFVTQFMQLILCSKNPENPCLECLNCRMVLNSEHPDVEWVKPEKSGGAIKIDQIRELQSTVFLTPQRSNHRLIAIEAADRMNTASANALLKILEEPAPHTQFILIAQQLSTVLPTILSRCQIVRFSSIEDNNTDLLLLGEKYSADSERTAILQQSDSILSALIAVIEGQQHPCNVVSQWSQFDMNNLLWFLYLIFAQLQYHYVKPRPTDSVNYPQMNQLASLLNPLLIFAQIDKINTLLRKISHNINVNQTLALEHLLFTLVK